MKIFFSPQTNNQSRIQQKPSCSYPNLKQLNRDTISFGAIKKSSLKGFSLAVTNMFKAPIEQFNSEQDLSEWAKKQLDKKLELGQYEVTPKSENRRDIKLTQRLILERKRTLTEWKKYITEENTYIAKNSAIGLIVFAAITKELKPDNKEVPEQLNRRAVADTLDKIEKNTNQTPNYSFNFLKMYNQRVVALAGIVDEEQVNGEVTGWIKIPSYKHEPQKFEENVKRLKSLSNTTWCTKSLNATPYLHEGDFHIYFDNGKARLGMRLERNKIEEVQGPKNDGNIPLGYFDIARDYAKSNGFVYSDKFQQQAQNAELKIKLAKAKIDLQDAMAAKDYEKILNYHGIETKKTDDGKLILSNYNTRNNLYTFQDLGVDENDMFLHIHEIQGDADFTSSEATSTGSLSHIGGNACFSYSKIAILENIANIDGNCDFASSEVTSLGKLKTIGKDANFCRSTLVSTGELTKIGGNGDFSSSKIALLNNLESIGGSAYFSNSEITSLEKLKYIGGYGNFSNSNVTSLGELESIGGSACFSNSKITSLEKLKYIGGYSDFSNSNVISLGNLQKVNGDIYTSRKDRCTSDFSKIQIGGKIKFNKAIIG